MKLKIRAIQISLITDKGPYGVLASFDNGLNVIRAENTSGKSALLNSILYALGFETLVGKRGVESTKPVLHSGGEFGSDHFNVIESYVELEIENCMGNIITARRWIKGDKDEKLVEVLEGPAVTGEKGIHYTMQGFFVGIEGAAQRERGYHQFLADFLKLNLPHVKRFTGGETLLYGECIFPLMFIEQVRGWSGIQASLRQSYGIRDVAKRCVEYILALDVSENERKKTEVLEDANKIQDEWRILRLNMTSVAARIGGTLTAVPSSPVTVLADEPWIAVSLGDETKDLDSLLISKRELLNNMRQQPVVMNTSNDELAARLEKEESSLLIEQAQLSQQRIDIQTTDNELTDLLGRFSFIEDDILRNKDIKRLRQFGMNAELHLANDRCPTCSQKISDSLLQSDISVMSLDDNIRFLEGEKEALKLLIEGIRSKLQQLRGRLAAQLNQVSHLRARIRDMRSDLLQTQSVSVADIREQIQLQEDIQKLEELGNEFQAHCVELKRLAVNWLNNRKSYNELPNEYYSAFDKMKLHALSKTFNKFVEGFGYRSTSHSHLHISQDNYRPVCDDFEVSFGASASDNIRLIWAYTLSLFTTSLAHGGNHWGLVVFDEPEQQQMQQASSEALYSAIAGVEPSDFQVIVATSADKDVVGRRLEHLRHKLLEFGDKVITPIKSV